MRLVLSLTFGISIGLIMALIFSREDACHDRVTNGLFVFRGKVPTENRPGLAVHR